jgi:hypothetical protein
MSTDAAAHTGVIIFINGHKFDVASHSFTGKQLKQLGNVPDNETLYLKVHGEERRIADDEVVELKSGEHFVSAPDGGVS